MVISTIPGFPRTRAFALTEMTGGIAYALGPMVAGPLYSLHHTLTFDVAIVGGLILIPVMFRANRRTRAMHAAIPIEPESALAVS